MLLFTVQLFAQQDQGKIRLIIRSDDMGCSHATNEGILQSYREGITTSIEVMVPTPWFPEAVEMLKQMPDVDVGVHLVLTSEWTNIKWRPLTDAPSLTDAWGYFYPVIWPNDRFPKRSALLEHEPKLEEIERELHAQIELAKREIPQLSHLSAHMGCMNMNEDTRALFRQLGEEYGLDVFVEDHDVQRLSGLGGAQLSPRQKIRNFVEALKELEPGTWLYVCHPSLNTPEQQSIGHPGYLNVGYDRAGVLAILTNRKVKALIEKRGIELIGYDDLAGR